MKRYAIFYPQFHHVLVNDVAWGHGFTDWALVSTANTFEYWNRRAPIAGFYDLAKTNDVAARFDEAAKAGLDGFGIYHYWFEDGRELYAVENYLMHNSVPKGFGYFFIWANENWTKRWAGRDTETIKFVATSPNRDQIRRHVEYLKPYMVSESYTMVLSRPVFVVYRPEFFRDPAHTISCYRDEFARVGVNPFIGYCIKSRSDAEYSNIFDFCYLFEPRLFLNFRGIRKNRLVHSVFRLIIHSVNYSKAEYWSEIVSKYLSGSAKSHKFSSYLKYFTSQERKNLIDSLRCPAQDILTCGWNNAPRYRDRFTEVQVPSKEQFITMLNYSVESSGCSANVPLLCNAWNEWSEGAAIEPCYYLGDWLLKSYVSQY
jgi:hypothetical protein